MTLAMSLASALPTPAAVPGTPEHEAFLDFVSRDAKNNDDDDRISAEERVWLHSEEIAPPWKAAL
jgi:hypothetical protein